MSQKVSFLAGADLSQGQALGIQDDNSVIPWAASGPVVGICYQTTASGSYASVYPKGSEQVPMLVSGSVDAGDLLIASTVVAGQVATQSFPVPSGTIVIGAADTDGSNGNLLYGSFGPYIV